MSLDTARPTAPIARGDATSTRRLLWLGAAGPVLFLGSSLLQGLTREGFDLRRHAASMLSNGDLGWIQISTFLLAGALVVAGAVGLRRRWRGQLGGRWAPRLIGVYGVSLLGAGIFRADPALGFPAGAPADMGTISWHGILHLLCGTIGFTALIVACGIVARHHRAAERTGWAVWSAVTGVVFAAAFLGLASGSASTVPAVSLSFWGAVALVSVWLAAGFARLAGRS